MQQAARTLYPTKLQDFLHSMLIAILQLCITQTLHGQLVNNSLYGQKNHSNADVSLPNSPAGQRVLVVAMETTGLLPYKVVYLE